MIRYITINPVGHGEAIIDLPDTHLGLEKL